MHPSRSVRRSKPVLFLVAAAALAGCLTTPNNHQQVCGANASVSFTGFLPWPNHGVVFQVATSPTGPWTQFGNTTSTGTAINYAGFTLYSFSKALPIPTWTSAGGALHAYVRARTNAGQQPGDQLWKELTTFEINPPVGGNAVGCIGNRVNNGATLNEALTYCASSSSPVVDITAPFASTCGCSNTVYNGDLVIDSAAAAAQYVCLQTLNGALTVTDGAPEVLPLASLQTISGNATLSYSYPFLMGTTIAYKSRTIDLAALTSIGGNLSITARRTDGSNLSYPFSMNAVTSVGGNILIEVYGLNPSGLAGLTSHTGNLTITGHNLDVNAGNLLTGLTHVTGDILVENIYATNNVLNSLQTVTGNVTLKKLLSHNNFLGLQSVSGNLRFETMQLLGATWASLTGVGGELALIGGPGLTSLQLLPVGATTAGSFRLETQPVMTTLAGSSFHVVGAGPITISGAPALSQCEVNTFLDAQQAAGWTGTPDVSGTIPCP